MKNIHLLPTDKSSRLSIKDGVLILHRLQWRKGTQNIYITSDEEIKMGDWHLVWLRDKWEVLNYMPSIGYRKECLGKEVCKIILTTDQDLIKDGVQAIPDEFLEWFIKNLSCEEVKIVNNWDYNNKGFVDHSGYKIIIPKEIGFKVDNGKRTETFYQKPKQDSVYKCTCLRPQVNCFSGMCSYCNRQIVKNLTTEDLKQKQETLEEVAEVYTEFWLQNKGLLIRDAFAAGAKWQQEQDKKLYSEEEVIELLKTFDEKFNSGIVERNKGINNWFEQFKKK